MRRVVLLLVVGSMMSAYGLHGAAAASPPDGITREGTAGCFHSTLLQRPGWTTSGVWQSTDEGERLLLADALNHVILAYTATGRSLGPVSGGPGTPYPNLAPAVLKSDSVTHELLTEIWSGPSDYNRILSLDRTLVPGPLHAVESAKFNPASNRISGLFDWEPVGGDVVAFTDVEGPPSHWNSAIVRFPMGDPEHFTRLHFVGLHDQERTIFRLGYQYITSLGKTAYVLRLDPPAIYKDAGPTRAAESPLVQVGDSLSTREQEANLQLPEFLMRHDFVPVMAAVERAAMPAGIYGWEQHLYVLSRMPDGDGTIWVLRKYDTEGKLLGMARLPTRANHLTPVPGPTSWAFVEKGPVKDYGIQDIKTVLFVPSSLLRHMQLPPPHTRMADAPGLCR
jgi:hypothetical protein